MNPITSILHQSGISSSRLNILCGDVHERYQTALCKTGHNFYSLKDTTKKVWTTHYGKIPDNYYHVEISNFNNFVNQIEFDLVFAQHKFGQFQQFQQIAQQLHLPFVYLEHTVPQIDFHEDKIDIVTAMRADINVFLWKYSETAWKANHLKNEIIYHGIDTEFWKDIVPIEDRPFHNLTVVNDFINRDAPCGYNLWNEGTANTARSVIGDTPNLSKSAKDENELLDIYNKHSVYVNTSLRSSLPMTLLEAAACGCAIITTKNCATPEIFDDSNCIFANTPEEIQNAIKRLRYDRPEMILLGEAARQTIIDKLPESQFIESWNKVFYKATQIPFIGATQ